MKSRFETVRSTARRLGFAALTATALLGAAATSALAQSQTPGNYSSQEMVQAGHNFFGTVSGNLATAIETAMSRYGQPNGYILGEEGSGALVGGLRYGEGTLYTRDQGQHKVYWQGPSIGWDFGGEGSRTMMLVYNLPSVPAVYNRFVGVAGSVYAIGGFGITALANDPVVVVPVRSGVGARLGVNVGYLKFTNQPTWNPF
jgi:hypothetical protein